MIVIRSESELAVLRQAGAIVVSVLRELGRVIRPGITTEELDSKAEELILDGNATPAFKGYRGYPKCICASVNEEIVHGIPSARVLREGDIVGIDVGVFYQGYCGDIAWTFPVGDVSSEKQRLMNVTREALYLGLSQAVEGNRLSDISHAIQSHVEENGFAVVREFVGHGIGTKMHEDPQIPNFGAPHRGPRLEPGMVLAIEPMVNAGTFEVEILDDHWTAVTKDHSPSAHFEHTVAVTSGEVEILTELNDFPEGV